MSTSEIFTSHSLQTFVPVLTSEAGMCLTAANWQQAGITHAAYYLDALIVKPGIKVLQSFRCLQEFNASPFTIILNTLVSKDLPVKFSQEMRIIRSPYDGSLISINIEDWHALIHHLKPDYAVMEQDRAGDYEYLGTAIPILTPGKNKNVYYHIEGENNMLQHDLASQPYWFESDLPANDALHGKIYDNSNTFNLLDSMYQDAFIPLAVGCNCFTCNTGYTRAYLHHLLQNTPLLAQRFLILHNVYNWKHK